MKEMYNLVEVQVIDKRLRGVPKTRTLSLENLKTNKVPKNPQFG